MENLINVLGIISLILFLTKFYLHSKIYASANRKSSMIGRTFIIYGPGIFLPIFKRSNDLHEKKLIKIANTLIYLSYLFFIAAIGIALIYFKGKY